jgi:hypothetical protein
VIPGQRQGQHQARLEGLAIPHRLDGGLAHAQDRHLGRIDDGREVAPANATQAGDGEAGARHLGRRQLAVARLLGQLAHFLADLQDALLVGILDHRHHQAVGRVGRKADMEVLLVDQGVAVQRAVGGPVPLTARRGPHQNERTGEVRGMAWYEVDFEHKLWTVPGERMKAGKEHRVPLSDAAMQLLESLKDTKLADTDIVFPSTRDHKPLSDMTLTAVLRRMKRDDITVHGFRSSFRDWAAEATDYPQEMAEMALAHIVGNKVEAAIGAVTCWKSDER